MKTWINYEFFVTFGIVTMYSFWCCCCYWIYCVDALYQRHKTRNDRSNAWSKTCSFFFSLFLICFCVFFRVFCRCDLIWAKKNNPPDKRKTVEFVFLVQDTHLADIFVFHAVPTHTYAHSLSHSPHHFHVIQFVKVKFGERKICIRPKTHFSFNL